MKQASYRKKHAVQKESHPQYIKSGKEVILLCDHTKFRASAFINISQLDCINRIIVGRELDVEYVDRLESLGIEVELV